MNAQDLIDDLQRTVRAQITRARAIAKMPSAQLLRRPSPEQWNVLEVFEHMNLSSGTYVRGLQRVFDERAGSLKANSVFRPGPLGNYFTRSMQPRSDGSIGSRMKTFRRFDPPRVKGATPASIDAFVAMCEQQLELLERARSTDLNRMKVTSTLGPIVRFKAGDAFRFPIAHQVRHMLQIERLLA